MRVHGHMADLAAVPGRAHERPPADDEAAADADLARDVQHVMGTDRRAATELREDAEIGIVGDTTGPPVWSAASIIGPIGTSRQPMFGAMATMPSTLRTRPATATPNPRNEPPAPTPRAADGRVR